MTDSPKNEQILENKENSDKDSAAPLSASGDQEADVDKSSNKSQKSDEENPRYERKKEIQRHAQAVLSPQTQQTIMEIIMTLRSNTSAETAQQLFKTLSETSTAVSKANQEAIEEDEKLKGKLGIGIDQQLKLLLDNLSANGLTNKKGEKFDPEPEESSEAGGSASTGQNNSMKPRANSSLITHAYHLINEVIMYPQIMWTRNFFYSLGAMETPQQQIMHDWFSEMNEKQQIYIKEIERANDQLKATASDLFHKKNFSSEQTDLFIKKVNFMENREYFFHKRKSMAQREVKEGESVDDTSDQKFNYQPPQTHYPKRYSQKNQQNQRKNYQPGGGLANKNNFFDKISSSCAEDGEKDQESSSQADSRQNQNQKFYGNQRQNENYRNRGYGANYYQSNYRGGFRNQNQNQYYQQKTAQPKSDVQTPDVETREEDKSPN